MKNKENIKVCLVGSSGGHLTHLYMLKLDMNFDYLFRSSYMPV